MSKKTNKNQRKRNLIVAATVVGVALIAAGVFAYRASKKESPDTAQGKVSIADSKTQDASKDSSSSPSPNSPAMTQTNPTTPPAVQTNNLPTPILAKSSGNNGSIPAGVLVNFTCESAPGYFCEIKLEKSGSSAIVLDKKQLTGERGQSFASWNWDSISGKWSATAVLSNAAGQSKSSAAQILEVR